MTIFLETERLILKVPEYADLDHLLALRSDPDVIIYLYLAIKAIDEMKKEVEEYLEKIIQYQKKYGFGFMSVFEKVSGDFIGQAGLFHVALDENQSEIEIAYRLHKKFWGKGYAVELSNALIQWGFETLKVDKLVAFTNPENLRSQRVLEKAGMYFTEMTTYRDHMVNQYEIYKKDCIECEPYNIEWPEFAEIEIKKLFQILPSNHIIDIQHVGSTAIPNMLAKPIIDIQIAVDSLDTIKQIAIDQLKTLDYQYWKENPDPERMFFTKGMPPFGEKRSHHVHIVELNSRHWKEKILFRDYLHSHPETADEYKKLKIKLAEKYKYNREKYTEAKTEFIQTILKLVNT